MAVQSRVLKVVLSNSYGDERSINVPNPKGGLTLSNVREAFNGVLTGQYLMNRNLTNPMTAVKSASIIETSSEAIS